MAGQPAPPVSFDQDFSGAVANLRDTTKWIIAAVATTGAGVLVGTPLTKVGALPFGWRLYLAAAGAAVGFCVLGMLYALAIRIIATEELTISDLAGAEAPDDGRRGRRLATALKQQMPSGCTTFKQLVAEHDRLVAAAESGDAAACLERDAFFAAVKRLHAPLAFEQKRLRFDDLSRGLLFLAPVLVMSVCLFAWAATGPESPVPLSSKPTLIRIAIPDTTSTRTDLDFQAGCYASSSGMLEVTAVVVADYPGYTDMIALPKAPCTPRRFFLKNNRLISH